jgi:hypothetical protein
MQISPTGSFETRGYFLKLPRPVGVHAPASLGTDITEQGGLDIFRLQAASVSQNDHLGEIVSPLVGIVAGRGIIARRVDLLPSQIKDVFQRPG